MGGAIGQTPAQNEKQGLGGATRKKAGPGGQRQEPQRQRRGEAVKNQIVQIFPAPPDERDPDRGAQHDQQRQAISAQKDGDRANRARKYRENRVSSLPKSENRDRTASCRPTTRATGESTAIGSAIDRKSTAR